MILTFGKHKGSSLEDVVMNDPGYILWMNKNNVIPIPSKILRKAKENELLDSMEPDLDCVIGDDWGDRD